MAFTERNLDIGHLCEINPINSNLHALLFIFDTVDDQRTRSRLNGALKVEEKKKEARPCSPSIGERSHFACSKYLLCTLASFHGRQED